MTLDLNCDLGEGEPPRRTRSLFRRVTSVNVACGGHAGTLASMRECARLAVQRGIHLGAHPGLPDREGFGRMAAAVSPDELELLLLQQVGALERIAREEGTTLHHIKLHGALYHATEQDALLARRYLEVVARHWPRAVVYAQARGRLVAMAGRGRIWAEAFLDRRYRADGSLVPRSEPDAVFATLRESLAQARLLFDRGEVITATGQRLRLNPRTVCLHGDGPHAAPLAALLGRKLGGAA